MLINNMTSVSLAMSRVCCSTIIKPVARLVYKQEGTEGNFRFGHMRLRAMMKEVALYKAAEAEKAHLEQLLQPVLANQFRLVMWRWLLNGCITGLDYAGALLTYTCLGLLVFTGERQKQNATLFS